MANCKTCGKHLSFLNKWDGTLDGNCDECDQIKIHRRSPEFLAEHPEIQQQMAELERQRAESHRKEEYSRFYSEWQAEPAVNGVVLIIISVVIAFFSLVFILAGEGAGVVGTIGLGISGILYLAGVIRWAVSSVYTVHFERFFRQNSEIIDLLEVLADKNGKHEDLDLLRRLRDTGQVSNQEYRIQRRQLLNVVKENEK